MKGTYNNITELYSEIQRIENQKQDYIIPAMRMRMHGDNDLMVFPGETMKINPVAHGQIANKLNIPKKYYDRMTEIPGLRALNVNEWLAVDDRKYMVRALDGNVRALLSDRYKPLDHSHVMAGVLKTLETRELQVRSVSLTERKMFLQVTFPSMIKEITRGDAVQYGLTISNSEVGAGSVDVATTIWRLVCANGMVGESLVNTRHVGRQMESMEDYSLFSDETIRADVNAFVLKLRDTVEGAMDEAKFVQLVERMKGATEDAITRPEQTVKNVTKRFDLSEEFGDLILSNMVEEGNLNRYGVMNGVTALAKRVESQDRAYELERLGHDILTLSKTEWEEVAA